MSVQAQSSLSSDSLTALRIKSKDLSTITTSPSTGPQPQLTPLHNLPAGHSVPQPLPHFPYFGLKHSSSSSPSLLPFLQSLLHSHFLQGALSHLHLTRAAAPPSHSTLTNPVTLPTYFSASHPPRM